MNSFDVQRPQKAGARRSIQNQGLSDNLAAGSPMKTERATVLAVTTAAWFSSVVAVKGELGD
jgi:hypothetical protein